MNLRRFIFSCTILFTFLFSPLFSVDAVTVSVDGVPASVNENQEFTINVSISSASANTTNYLRTAFYSESSPTSYFGYTFNHLGEWYNGSPSPIDPHKFLQIEINSEKLWSGELKVKIDSSNKYFNGNGNYYFKVGRYTASGTSVSDWSNSFPVNINAPTPTFTPIPTSALTPTPIETVTPTKKPTNTLTPTPKSSNGQNVSPKTSVTSIDSTEKNKSELLNKEEASESSSEILGGSTLGASLTPTKINSQSKVEVRFLGMTKRTISEIFIALGIIFLTICVILFVRKYKLWDSNEEV